MKLTGWKQIALGILMMVIAAVVIGLIVYFVTYGEYSLCLTSNHTELLVPLLGKLGILKQLQLWHSGLRIWCCCNCCNMLQLWLGFNP